jgi:hypothetical protein
MMASPRSSTVVDIGTWNQNIIQIEKPSLEGPQMKVGVYFVDFGSRVDPSFLFSV